MVNNLTHAPVALMNFLREARDELKKVSWPDRQITLRYTVIVVVASLVVGLVIGGIDYLFTLLIERFILEL